MQRSIFITASALAEKNFWENNFPEILIPAGEKYTNHNQKNMQETISKKEAIEILHKLEGGVANILLITNSLKDSVVAPSISKQYKMTVGFLGIAKNGLLGTLSKGVAIVTKELLEKPDSIADVLVTPTGDRFKDLKILKREMDLFSKQLEDKDITNWVIREYDNKNLKINLGVYQAVVFHLKATILLANGLNDFKEKVTYDPADLVENPA